MYVFQKVNKFIVYCTYILRSSLCKDDYTCMLMYEYRGGVCPYFEFILLLIQKFIVKKYCDKDLVVVEEVFTWLNERCSCVVIDQNTYHEKCNSLSVF